MRSNVSGSSWRDTCGQQNSRVLKGRWKIVERHLGSVELNGMDRKVEDGASTCLNTPGTISAKGCSRLGSKSNEKIVERCDECGVQSLLCSKMGPL